MRSFALFKKNILFFWGKLILGEEYVKKHDSLRTGKSGFAIRKT
jgi:hypothetical protein